MGLKSQYWIETQNKLETFSLKRIYSNKQNINIKILFQYLK